MIMGAQPSPYLMPLSAMFFWGPTYIIVRVSHEGVPPITLNFWRWVVVLVLLLPWTAAAAWWHRAVLRQNAWLLGALSVTGVALYQSAAYIALDTTTTINAGLIYATVPVVTPLISYALFRKFVTPRQALGIAISMVDVVAIIVRAEWGALVGFLFTPGDLWILLSVVAWALYSVLLGRLRGNLSPFVLMMVLAAIGVVVLLPFYGWEWAVTGGSALSRSTVLALAYLSVASAIVSYVYWNNAVAVIGANKAGLFLHLIPVFTVVLAILVLGEQLKGFHIAGTGLIVTGIYLTVTRTGTTRSKLSGRCKAC
ncbi:MAG: DMT family transporter [Rhodospirillales bacterium]|nr:DMT family transporter [Rhodospirillales bacterium]